jgi:phenylacetate-CoA ligase
LEEAFHAIPIIERPFFKSNFNLFLSGELNESLEKGTPANFYMETTSGTSGSRFTCYKSNSERIQLAMAVWKRRKLIDPLVEQASSYCIIHIPYTQKNVVEYGDFYNPEKIATVLNYLVNDLRPRMIHGGPPVICAYAKFIEENKIDLKGWRPSFIELNGMGTTAWQRDYISRVFGCKVVNNYGSIELWNMAYDCPEGLLHLSDHICMELRSFKDGSLLPPGSNEPGEVIATSLVLRAQPFIRYNLRDIGWISDKPCSCGSKAPVIHLHESRTAHYLDSHVNNVSIGSGIHLFNQVMEELSAKGHSGIKQYKVIQMERELFNVYIDGHIDNTECFCNDFIHSTVTRLGRKPVFDFQFLPETDEMFTSQKPYSFVSNVIN